MALDDRRFRSNFDKLEQSLIEMRAELGDAEGRLVVSGHWEGQGFFVSSVLGPGMVYAKLLRISSTFIASATRHRDRPSWRNVRDLLVAAGVGKARSEPGLRSWHFQSGEAAHPEENIPVVQLSLDSAFEPSPPWVVGRAIASLREKAW